MTRPLDEDEILQIVDQCLAERLRRAPARLAPDDVRTLSLTCQRVLFAVYWDLRAKGSMGEAEDILRNDNIKTAIASLPDNVRPLARDILTCSHARMSTRETE